MLHDKGVAKLGSVIKQNPIVYNASAISYVDLGEVLYSWQGWSTLTALLMHQSLHRHAALQDLLTAV